MIYSGTAAFDMSFFSIENFRVHNVTTDQMNALAASVPLGINHKGVEVWNTNDDAPYFWNGATWVSALGYTNQMAINAVTGIFDDSNTIDLRFATGRIHADARLQMSLTSNQEGIKLTGDVLNPGASKYYGTDSVGNKGWYQLPSNGGGGGGGGVTYSFQQSLSANSSNVVTLFNDQSAPGLMKYYGSNAAGTKGWYALPNSGKNYTFPNSVKEINGTIILDGDADSPGNGRYYGTNGSGVKGWYALPVAGSAVTFQQSIVNTSGFVNLVNDTGAPGSSKYYGTNVSGLRGWFDLPSISTGLLFLQFNYQVDLDINHPQSNNNIFLLKDCDGNLVTGKRIFIFRSGEFLHQGVHFSYDTVTAAINFVENSEPDEPITVIAMSSDLWQVCDRVGSEVVGNNFFPYSFDLIF
jgi:hypothetical protein